MLTYGSPAPPVRTLFRRIRTATSRRASRPSVDGMPASWPLCSPSLVSGLASASTWSLRSSTRQRGALGRGCAVSATTRSLHSIPSFLLCQPPLHKAASAKQTILRIPQDGLACKAKCIPRADVRMFQDRAAVPGSFRHLSVTRKRPVKENDARDPIRDQALQSHSPQQQPQKQLKGFRKVLPSLTPHENIYTVPNLLTFSRLAVAPFIGYAILHDAHTWALGLFAYAGISDLLDGWIARRWKLQTVVGSVVDPMADKTLMTVLTICLATKGALPVWLAAIILGRDVGLGIAAIYYRWISLPPPKTFTRYWDFSLPSAEVRPTTVSKYNTFLQLGLMGAMMVAPVVTADIAGAITALQYLVATTTVWSGLSYVFSKDAVRILSSEKKEKKPKD